MCRKKFASDQNSLTSDVNIFTKILGPRLGYLSGLSRCVKPYRSSSLSKNASKNSKALEDVKFEIEELRTRQHELEAQVVQ